MATRVIPGSGAVFTPNFDAEYRVTSFTIHDGGTGYASTDPPKIEILGTKTPLEEGSFYPIIANGKITQIAVLNSGRGYFPFVYNPQQSDALHQLPSEDLNHLFH